MTRTDQLELLFDAGPPNEASHGAAAGAGAAAPVAPDAPRAGKPATSGAPTGAASDSAPAPSGGPALTLRPTPAPTPGSTLIPTPCPDSLPHGARWREVATPQQTIGFVLLRSRRRSIGFVVADDGLRVTAPNWVTLGQIDDAVREKARWILSKLRDWHARREQLALTQTRWQAGGELPYLGKRIRLDLGADRRQAHFDGDADAPEEGQTLWLPLPANADGSRIRDAAQAWLQQRASAWFGARLAHFLQISGLKISRWRLSSATTRWGSCTSDGNVMLNWRLIHFSPDIIDYVIAHELAHLREMNHSPNFWSEVGQILPNYEQAKRVLKQHDPAMLPQF
ncbi:M48 family metallopeptidase [Bordetella genomosp. 5]|uniref:M48 family metallopeptidase n=1 Tax=Bordetella genomosp. 5 TaxID=1395608 RepID=UPI0020160AF6|nr:SprT family zinc-dependent metalloprotease [Bordetella genomosp. 5]